MRVEVDIVEEELEGDHGLVEGIRLICERCGYEVTVFGTSDRSARRGAAMLAEDCPNDERNYYDVNWYA